jgi:transcriptional regulator with XRE-family HTH domain
MSLARYLVTPTRSDIKAARNYLDWSQEKLGEMCGASGYTINSFENKRHKMKKEQLDDISLVFAEYGIRFNPEGGFRVEKEVVKIYEGRDAYSKVQKDIIETCIKEKKEVLYLGGDDKYSTKKMIKEDRRIYDLQIPIKSLVNKDAKCIAWPEEIYKKIEDYYLLSDLTIIYDDKVIFTANVTLEPYSCKLLAIRDIEFAKKWRKYFYNLWDNIKYEIK